MNSLAEFLTSYYLWSDAIIVAAASGAVCGFIGVYVVLRRIVFVSATLTQISGLGVVTFFYLQSMIGGSIFASANPFYFAVFITSVSAVLFSVKRDFAPVSMEGIIGFGFLVASALTIIISASTTQGRHEIENIMFGNAVVAAQADLIIIPVVSFCVLLVHLVFYKDFLFISYDVETAIIYRYPVRILNILMYVILGITAAVCTRAIGALPVFAMLTLPALTSLYLTEKLKYVFVFSLLAGVVAATAGYFFSFIFSIPTGASMVLCSTLIFIAGIGVRRIKKIVRFTNT